MPTYSTPYTFDSAPGPTAQRVVKASATRSALLEPIGSVQAERDIVALALERLKALAVDFGDIRLGRDHHRVVTVQDDDLNAHQSIETSGIGVRALVRGFWGFAAVDDLSPAGVRRAVEQAVAMARGVASVSPKDRGLSLAHWAAEPAHVTEFHTPIEICPFNAEVGQLAAPFIEAARIGLAVQGIKRAQAYVSVYGRRRIFASTDGAFILTTHAVIDAQQRFIAVDRGTSAYRTVVSTALAGGLEHLVEADFPGAAKAAAEEAVLKCGAARPDPGTYTLILDGHNLALTMHESVGHPTELDRVLGYELGFAGGSFASLDKLGTFRYGSPQVNFTANNRLRYGGASVGYDDEGVECQSFPVIREGTLVGYGTSRETAHQIGATRANGTCRATSWYDAPIVRIPNLFLEPSPTPLSLKQLIGDTEDGILMLGRDSFSIDQMRYNFQFGADMCYRIRRGAIAEPLKDVIYQSISPEFWGSMDAVCDASEWQIHGVANCGKGQPVQSAKMMHGAAPARFRGIRVGF